MKTLKPALALALLCSSSAMANDINFYGKANLTGQVSDDGDGSFTEIKSNASRVGVNGGLKVDESLTVIYKVEVQVDMDGDSDDNISARNQYIGLKGTFGEVLLGKNDTVTKQSQGKVDLFNDYEGDIKVLWKGENRMDDTLTYKSPKVNDFQFGLTYSAEGDEESEDGISAAIMYGDAKLKKSTVFASIAFDDEVKGFDVLRTTVSFKFADIKFGAMYQTQENVESDEEMDGLMVSAAYDVGDYTFKAQVQTADYDDQGDLSGYNVGLDYKLAKNAKLFAFYTTFDMDQNNDQDYVATGLELKF